jgi:hypothetical protein
VPRARDGRAVWADRRGDSPAFRELSGGPARDHGQHPPVSPWTGGSGQGAARVTNTETTVKACVAVSSRVPQPQRCSPPWRASSQDNVLGGLSFPQEPVLRFLYSASYSTSEKPVYVNYGATPGVTESHNAAMPCERSPGVRCRAYVERIGAMSVTVRLTTGCLRLADASRLPSDPGMR